MHWVIVEDMSARAPGVTDNPFVIGPFSTADEALKVQGENKLDGCSTVEPVISIAEWNSERLLNDQPSSDDEKS